MAKKPDDDFSDEDFPEYDDIGEDEIRVEAYIHFILPINNKYVQIPEKHRKEIEKNMKRIVNESKCPLFAVYCMPDHAHLLINLNPELSMNDFFNNVNKKTSAFFTEYNITKEKFNFHEDYAAYGTSKRYLDREMEYILNQKNVHKKITFKEEFKKLLTENGMEYDEKEILKWLD